LDGDTGFASGPVFVCDVTVAFHALKPGHLLGDGPDLCGHVAVVDIGLSGGDAAFMLMTGEDVAVPHRARRAHKWSSGAVATIGGMPGLTGAAGFASAAALRAGAGVSNVAAIAETAAFYQHRHPEVPVMTMDGNRSAADADEVLDRLGRFDALIVGPGLEPASAEFVSVLLERFSGAVVVDAGALNAIRSPQALVREGLTVLTPHEGEFRRLTGVGSSLGAAHELAQVADAIVVLKGNPTVVADATTAIVVNVGGPELATIGTGDVLAGTIAAFLAGSDDPLVAVASAVYVHGAAGANATHRTVPTVLDVLAAIGPTVRMFS
jgi:NAD(P)H-hydrate epimerase